MMLNRNLFGAAILIGLIGLTAVFWSRINPIPIGTGRTVAISPSPYNHLTYNKYAPDHNGNFTGDVYLLDMDQKEIVQLTKGGTTANANWLNNELLLISYRPRGSVVDPYYLNVSTGRLSAAGQQVQALQFNNEFSARTFSSNGEYYFLQLTPDENLQNNRYAVLRIAGDEVELASRFFSAGYSAPAWVPNSNILVYGQPNDEICLLDAESKDDVCRSGTALAVSTAGRPITWVAFVDKIDGRFHVCTAEIEAFAFDNVECHDDGQQQIINLAWRP